VRAEEVDHRTDIFSFGAVLYEMISGQRAFKRDTETETMTAILKEDPPEFTGSALAVSPGLDRIVRRALEKSPDQRFQSAKDLAFALDAVAGGSTRVQAFAAEPRRQSRRMMAALAGVLLLAAVAVAAYFVGRQHTVEGPQFERLTFQRGYIRGARFSPDGKDVVYSALWEGRPYEAFTMRIGDRHARSLGVANAMVVGVTASGEVALLTNVRRIRSTAFMQVGTLARVPISGGGAPREILEGVWDADVSRDGRQFAIVRSPSGQQQLEYPIGKVLFKTQGYISHPRISPDGTQVAFLEHPLFGDDRGYVDVVDASARVKRLAGEFSSEQGIAWTPDGREIWFGAPAPNRGIERGVWAIAVAGPLRKVVDFPENATVSDIAQDGRLLFSHESLSSGEFVASPPNGPEHDVSVLGYATWGTLSDDGKSMAFSEAGNATDKDYLVFVRRLDGSQAVEIGEGLALGITPDGRNVVALVPSQPTKMRVLPTGAGESRTVDIAPVQLDAHAVSWMPDGKEFVFLGHQGDDRPSAWRMSLDGGPPKRITKYEGGEFWNRVSPDGRSLLQAKGTGLDAQGSSGIVDIGSGTRRPAPLQDGDQPLSWDLDGRHAFIAQQQADAEATIYRVDLSTGTREVWKRIQPTDPAGLVALGRFFVTPSGNAYAYSATRFLSSLYVLSQR